MSDIDRRTLLVTAGGAGLIGGVAGGGLALVGCKYGPFKQADVPVDDMSPSGYCANHGDPPNTPKSFTPEEMCVVYIKFDGGPAPSVTQGYIDNLIHTDDTYLQGLANEALKELAGIGTHSVSFYLKRYNFNLFSFRCPTKVVIFVDNPDTKIRFCEEPQGAASEYVIRFTAFTGRSSDPHAPSFRPTRFNQNFYGVDRITINGLAGPAAYWFNFLNRKNATTTQIQHVNYNNYQTWWSYSMNIHLLAKSPDDSTWIPLVLDPDTGNMGSNP
jgi:hypothetical protein